MTCCRPVLAYGVENLSLIQTDSMKAKRAEGNIVKNMFPITKYARTTPLLDALKIESIDDYTNRAKLELFIRLNRNPHTSAAITETFARPEGAKWQAKSLASDITQVTDSLPYARNRTENLETLLFKAKILSEALFSSYFPRLIANNGSY